jgi:tetratricopeptide (TPR) repeat protein
MIFFVLLIFILFNFFFFDIKFFLADYYFNKAAKADIYNDCRTSLDNLNKTVELNAFNYYYKDQYIFYNLNCLSATESKLDKKIIFENIFDQASVLRKNERNYLFKIDLARAFVAYGDLFDKDYYDKAENLFKELLNENKYITLVYEYYGKMKFSQKKYDEAIDIYKKGVETTPKPEEFSIDSRHKRKATGQLSAFYKFIAKTFLAQNKKEEAIEYLEKYSKIRADQEWVHLKLLELQKELKKKSEVVR